MSSYTVILGLLWGLLAFGVAASDILPGPIPARVLGVVDGDTLDLHASIWPGQTVTFRARLLGIDTPELRGACFQEQFLATSAKALTARWVADQGGQVTLHAIQPHLDPFGRILARVQAASGEDLGTVLVQQGLARVWTGRQESWCPRKEGQTLQP